MFRMVWICINLSPRRVPVYQLHVDSGIEICLSCCHPALHVYTNLMERNLTLAHTRVIRVHFLYLNRIAGSWCAAGTGMPYLGQKWVRLALNLTNPERFQISFEKLYRNLIWKSPGFVAFEANLDPLWGKIYWKLIWKIPGFCSIFGPNSDTHVEGWPWDGILLSSLWATRCPSGSAAI